MPPNKKPYALIAIGVVVLLSVVEFGLSHYRGTLGCVMFVNEGAEPIENLRVVLDDQVAEVSRIEAGASAKIYLSGHGKNILRVKYRQKGSPLTGFEIAEFDPDALVKESFQLVLRIRPNEFERYQDDADPSLLERFTSRFKRWFMTSLESQ